MEKDMSTQLLAFIDVETTGHYPLRKVRTGQTTWQLQPNHEIIELGAGIVDPTTLEIVAEGEFAVKIDPSGYALANVDHAAEKVNHFLERRAKGEWNDAVPVQDGMQQLLGFCKPFGKLVIGNQNFFFDWLFINTARIVSDITEPEWDTYFHYGMFDTRSMAIQELWKQGVPFNPSNFSVRQNQLCEALGIPPEPNPHTSLNGVRTAIEVFRELTKRKMIRFSA